MGRLEHDHHHFIGQLLRKLVADHGVMIELRENLVESPGLAVLVKLGLPAMSHLGDNAGAIYHRQTAMQAAGQLLGLNEQWNQARVTSYLTGSQ